MNAPHHSRRNFLKQSTGLVIGFTWMGMGQADGPPVSIPIDLKNNPQINSWLRINANGTIDIFAGKVEFGQGITTALRQIAADEMDVPINQITMNPCTTGISPNEGVTSGSQSIEYGGLALRYACAQAKATLLERAATQLNVPITSLSVRDGTIFSSNGKSVSYGSLVDEKMLYQTANGINKPKPVNEHRYIGQSVARVDIPAKVSGGQAYLQDMRLPGMLHARIVRPPAPRASLMNFNEAAIKGMPGYVGIVRDGSFLAVVAKREEQAIKILNAAKAACEWKLANDLPSSTSAWLSTMKTLKSVDTEHGVKSNPNSPPAIRTLVGEFTKPYIAHGSIGPSCSIALFNGDIMKVYSHAQGMYPLHRDLIKSLGMPADKIICTHVEGSGMYGQSGADDVCLDAALVARKFPNSPIRVQWMREDEFKWEPYSSAMSVKISAGIDAQGKIVRWEEDIWSNTHSTRPGEKTGNNLISSWYLEKPQAPSPVTNIPLPAGGSHRNGIPLYTIPNQMIRNHLIEDMPFRVSALRTLGAYANVFSIESMMDELANEARIDPLQFRLNHLENARATAVIQKVKEMSKWDPKKLRSKKDGLVLGRGIGFAQYKNLQVYVAVVADVEVNPRTGKVKVLEMFCAAEAGLIINPDGFRNQIEGGLIQTTSWTINEAVPINASGVQAASWGDYPILKFEDVPTVHVELINRPSEKSLGVGEGSQGPGVAAIANAFAAATRKRVYDLPMNSAKVKQLFT